MFFRKFVRAIFLFLIVVVANWNSVFAQNASLQQIDHSRIAPKAHSLQSKSLERGKRGKQGKRGKRGKKGKRGQRSSIAGPIGPVGAMGATGAIGAQGSTGPTGSIAQSYISSYTSGSQGPITSSITPILFATDRIAGVGITHPAMADTSKFEVAAAGNYIVSYSCYFTLDNTVVPDIATLYILQNGTAITPVPLEIVTLPGSPIQAAIQAASASVLLPLNANDVVQLAVSSSIGNINISSPTWSMVKITP